MRFYETLGIDLTTEEGVAKLLSINCADVGDEYSDANVHNCPKDTTCDECIAKRLFKEVKTKKVKRWETIKSDEDVKKMYERFVSSYTWGWDKYLCEEIEVEVYD